MSVTLYDMAVVEFFRGILNDDRIHIIPPSEVFDLNALIKEDKIVFPLISLNRPSYSTIPERTSHALKFDGATLGFDEKLGKFKYLQAIPMQINYTIDVWTYTREENDAMINEFIWYLSTHPRLRVNVPHSLENFKHNFNLFVDNNIIDNSDIVEHRNRGIYFRQTLNIYTDDAYLWKTSSRYPNRVEAELKVNGIDE